MVKKKHFLQIQIINTLYLDVEDMIVVPITKRKEIITSFRVSHISQLNINYEENGGKKAFLAYPKNQYRVSHCKEHDCSTHNQINGNYNEYPSFSYFMDEL